MTTDRIKINSELRDLEIDKIFNSKSIKLPKEISPVN